MKYKRSNIDSTIKAALYTAKENNVLFYVFALAGGFTIEKTPPIGIGQGYFLVEPNGQVTKHNTWIDAGNRRLEATEIRIAKLEVKTKTL